jgi:hypothetical protein
MLQFVIVVDGATFSQKDGVEDNGGSLKGGTQAFMLLLCGAQQVLRSSVLTVLDLDEVNVTLVTRGYKDGLQPETLADGNWLVKQNQPVSKIETKSGTNLRSLYES